MCNDEPRDSWMMAVINVVNNNEHCQNVFKTEESVNITPSVEVEAIDFFDVEKPQKSDNNCFAGTETWQRSKRFAHHLVSVGN